MLNNISPAIVNHNIFLFLEYNFGLIAQECCLNTGWLGKEIITYLVQNVSGLFIWAATTYWFIYEGKQSIIKKLDIIIHGSSNAAIALKKHFNEIYAIIFKHLIYPNYIDEERKD